MKTKRFQECKADAIPIEKIAQERAAVRSGVLQSLNFTPASSEKIKEMDSTRRKIVKGVSCFPFDIQR